APSPRSRVGTPRPPSAPCAPSRSSTPDTTVPRGSGSFPRGTVLTDARPSPLHGEPGHLARGPALGVGCDRDVERPRAGGRRPDPKRLLRRAPHGDPGTRPGGLAEPLQLRLRLGCDLGPEGRRLADPGPRVVRVGREG